MPEAATPEAAMIEREPTPEPPNEGGDGGGGKPAGPPDDVYTPTNLGDYEIREGEYGPLERGRRDQVEG